ncbi:MAG: hypothetical protein DWQ48_00060 [Bacteroidetes bacterium]|nr:MAG: hypothetical protein DWQ48_00060 [Bacteroidota bacterium]
MRTGIITILILLSVLFKASGQTNAQNEMTQNTYREIIQTYINEHADTWGMNKNDLQNWQVSDQYTSSRNGFTYVYLNQTVNDVRIFNYVSAVAIRNNKVLSIGKKFFPNAENSVNTLSPAITPEVAVQKAAEHLELNLDEALTLIESESGS